MTRKREHNSFLPGLTPPEGEDPPLEALKDPHAYWIPQILNALRTEPMTADECGELLGVHLLTNRPRFTELNNAGLIRDTGRTRPNKVSGKQAIVWEVADDR